MRPGPTKVVFCPFGLTMPEYFAWKSPLPGALTPKICPQRYAFTFLPFLDPTMHNPYTPPPTKQTRKQQLQQHSTCPFRLLCLVQTFPWPQTWALGTRGGLPKPHSAAGSQSGLENGRKQRKIHPPQAPVEISITVSRPGRNQYPVCGIWYQV